jgi:hypothetical protein
MSFKDIKCRKEEVSGRFVKTTQGFGLPVVAFGHRALPFSQEEHFVTIQVMTESEDMG